VNAPCQFLRQRSRHPWHGLEKLRDDVLEGVALAVEEEDLAGLASSSCAVFDLVRGDLTRDLRARHEDVLLFPADPLTGA
jgi:hypothetical protein